VQVNIFKKIEVYIVCVHAILKFLLKKSEICEFYITFKERNIHEY